MGRDKASLPYPGSVAGRTGAVGAHGATTMVEHVLGIVTERCEPVFVIAAPGQPLPALQARIIRDRLRLFVIDASKVARDVGLPGRTNTILQTCFFAISGVLPREQAIAHIKESIRKSYSRKGQSVVDKNFAAVDIFARLSYQ